MIGHWSRLDRRVRSLAVEGVRFGLMTRCWVAQQPDARRLHLVMLTWQHSGRYHVIGRRLCPVKHDRTRPVGKNHFWKLTRNDRTLGVQRPVTVSCCVRSFSDR